MWNNLYSVTFSGHHLSAALLVLMVVSSVSTISCMTSGADSERKELDALTLGRMARNLRALRLELVVKGRQALMRKQSLMIRSSAEQKSSGSALTSTASPPSQSAHSHVQAATTIFQHTRGTIQQATSPLALPSGRNRFGKSFPSRERAERSEGRHSIIIDSVRYE